MSDLFSYSPEMCSDRERNERVIYSLIHVFEYPEDYLIDSDKSSTTTKSSLIQTQKEREENKDKYRLINKFSRSAAGTNMKKDLRSPLICQRTSNYLIYEILIKDSPDFDKTRYHFVFDRLRSVRQDPVMQDCRNLAYIRVLDISVRFHIYSGYKLCLSPLSEFDPKINFTHTIDSLRELLVLFEENQVDLFDNKYEEMVACYLIVSLGIDTDEALNWLFKQDKSFRRLPLIKLCLQAHLGYLQGNFVAIFKIFKNLPLLCQLAFHWIWPNLLKTIMNVFNVAFSSKTCQFPFEKFCTLFCVDQDVVENVSSILAVNIDKKKQAICFFKSSFNPHKKIPHFHSKIIDQKLKSTSLYEVLLPAM